MEQSLFLTEGILIAQYADRPTVRPSVRPEVSLPGLCNEGDVRRNGRRKCCCLAPGRTMGTLPGFPFPARPAFSSHWVHQPCNIARSICNSSGDDSSTITKAGWSGPCAGHTACSRVHAAAFRSDDRSTHSVPQKSLGSISFPLNNWFLCYDGVGHVAAQYARPSPRQRPAKQRCASPPPGRGTGSHKACHVPQH